MDVERILKLCLYIATSAAGLRTEPKEYGPVRLIEVLARLADAGGQDYDDPFLRRLASDAQEKIAWIMTDKESFHRYLDDLVIELVRESKRRNAPNRTPG